MPKRITRSVERWFASHQRSLPWRSSYDPYAVWVSEVMLQQTRMEVVLRYYDRFLARFPDLAALAAADDDSVLASWSGLGYYRRARMLRDGAREVIERFGGRVPDDVAQLASIAGVGRYTAGAIASIAYGRRVPIVDGNIARITSRLSGIAQPAGSPALMRAAWIEAEKLVEACKSPRMFNQGLMEIGALICRPGTPDCASCPLTRDCFAFANRAQSTLPRPRAQKQTRRMQIALYVVRDACGRVLMRRGSGKLMRAMFHLPHGDTSLLPGVPLAVSNERFIGSFRHTVTTRRIEFQLFEAGLTSSIRDGEEYAWIDPAALSSVPHPSYVKKALEISAAAGIGSR